MLSAPFPLRPAEQRALEIARSIPGQQILCTTVGRAQAAAELAAQRPDARVVCWFLDQFHLQQSELTPRVPNLALVCQPDVPSEEFDLAVIPTAKQGEAELTRDLLQSASERLSLGGILIAATDNPRDTWLHAQLVPWFDKITVHKFSEAVVYQAIKHRPLSKLKNFRCEFVFRDGDRLIRALSRPGVFSHRHIDPGARQLLAHAEIQPAMRVLDIGCGAGTVALALAAREPTATVHAVDSSARAIECTLAGASLNQLTNITAELNSSGNYSEPGTYDLVVANPPYYADFSIAEKFVAAAERSMRPGGQLLLVTKSPAWYEEHLPPRFERIAITTSRQYFVVSGEKGP